MVHVVANEPQSSMGAHNNVFFARRLTRGHLDFGMETNLGKRLFSQIGGRPNDHQMGEQATNAHVLFVLHEEVSP